MFQEFITYLIVGSAIAYTLFSFYQTFTVKNKGVCGGCAKCELKKELKKKGKLYLHGKQKNQVYRMDQEKIKYIPNI